MSYLWSLLSSQGSVISAIGGGIIAIISAIAGVIETIIGAIVSVRVMFIKMRTKPLYLTMILFTGTRDDIRRNS
jgi:hypothetical protein